MRLFHGHPWDISPREAVAIQHELRQWVVATNASPELDTLDIASVAGVDVSARGGMSCAAIAELSFPTLTFRGSSTAVAPLRFPYVPGLLSFREAPAILAALKKMDHLPDVLIFDGQGMAHPRRLGIATHIGVLLDHPTIGCAKSRLVGCYAEPEREVGSWRYLYDGEEIIGAVVRTRTGVKPVFVSVGHKVDLITAIKLVLRCCRRYRLPETTRWAHRVAGNIVLPAIRQGEYDPHDGIAADGDSI